jgi:hypothetical protein
MMIPFSYSVHRVPALLPLWPLPGGPALLSFLTQFWLRTFRLPSRFSLDIADLVIFRAVLEEISPTATSVSLCPCEFHLPIKPLISASNPNQT